MSLLEFCLLNVTWRYSCLFLLREFHSWVVSLFLAFFFFFVLTFTWIEGASHTKHCSVNNVWLPNNDVQVWTPLVSLSFELKGMFHFLFQNSFRGDPGDSMELENKTKPEWEGCYTDLPRVCFFFCRLAERGKKVEKGRQRESGRDAEEHTAITQEE